jgi:hypothetical protein
VPTICEALGNLDRYRGKDVVIVGRYGFAFESPFMGGKCAADGRTLIQGHRWLSMIVLSTREAGEEACRSDP